jgi:hypothetical protein
MVKNDSTLAPISAAAILALLVLTLYVGGYVGLGARWETNSRGGYLGMRGDEIVAVEVEPSWERCYGTEWEAVLFRPAAWLESWIRQFPVTTSRR